MRVARASCPKGNRYARLRDERVAVFANAWFAGLFPTGGRPAQGAELATIRRSKFRTLMAQAAERESASSIGSAGESKTRGHSQRGTELARATWGTILLRLPKVGALVRISVRRVKVPMILAAPSQAD